MKRIEFIAPVAAMRGNLSGSQDLRYAENDNKAWEAPEGRQYARNYQPRFIGAKVSKSGLKFFAVRTKSASNLSDAARMQEAVIGGTQALIAGMKSAYTGDENKYDECVRIVSAIIAIANGGGSWTEIQRAKARTYCFHNGLDENTDVAKFVNAKLRDMLKYKKVSATFGTETIIGSTLVVSIYNPWNIYAQSTTVLVNGAVWLKFMRQLGFSNENGTILDLIYFVIDGRQFVGVESVEWLSLADNGANATHANMKALYSEITIDSETDQAKYSGAVIYLGETAQTDETAVVDGAAYKTEQA